MLISLLNFGLPLVAEMLAANRTKGILRSYFLAQIGCTVSCWLGWQLWGIESNWYRLVYSLATMCVLVPSFLLTWQSGARLWVFLLSALSFSFPVGLWCFLNTSKHDADFWIVAVEASLLAFLGAAAGFRVHLTLDRNLLFLSVLWLLLAGYDCVWISVDSMGETVNAILPMYLVTAASLAVALHSTESVRGHDGLSSRHPI